MHLLDGLFNDTKFIADATLLNEQRSNFHFDSFLTPKSCSNCLC
ncbi:hypothetical protein [Hyphomicrobium sp. NDB2Meth4]|nr:hypothetical protein [Hyphomicrobium sp. NDB2Meth4]